MVDLTNEMANLWAALGPAPSHRGRVIQFVSAQAGEGVSTVAREFARVAAARARKPIWLIDADLAQQSQADAVAADAPRFGALGKAALASPDGSAFYTVTPPVRGKDGQPIRPARLLTAQPCLGGRLWVSRFRMEALRSGQKVEFLSDGAYWDALRRHAETVVIDCPAADRSDAAVAFAPYVDAAVLVVAAETTEAAGPAALRDELEAVGGRVAGLVMNRARWKPPAFIRRLAG